MFRESISLSVKQVRRRRCRVRFGHAINAIIITVVILFTTPMGIFFFDSNHLQTLRVTRGNHSVDIKTEKVLPWTYDFTIAGWQYENAPRDAHNQPYVLVTVDAYTALVSAGHDGEFDTEDDNVLWLDEGLNTYWTRVLW